MPKPSPDWSRTGTVAGYAEYLGKQADAICVLVIRPHDSLFAVDPRCAPEDAERLVIDYVPRGWSWGRCTSKKRKEHGNQDGHRVDGSHL